MFKTRVISGFFLTILTLFTIITGGNVLLFTLLFISEVGLFELYRVMKMEKKFLAGVGYVATAAWYAVLYHFVDSASDLSYYFMLLSTVSLLFMLFAFVLRYPKFSAVQLFLGSFGFLYVSVMLSFIFLTRMHIRLGEWLVWLIFISSWGSDTWAYFIGRLFGKRKLAPVLSPKKSIEGSIGGIVASAFFGGLFGFLMCSYTSEPYSVIPLFTVIGGVGSVISQVGDLAASGIKRNFEVKDYGSLIPGHGGVLDRFDSIIITAPIVFFLADIYAKFL